MITIDIDGFQSLANFHLVIERLTGVTGPSNTGKSAIVRALEAFINNESGESFIRTGQDRCVIQITTHNPDRTPRHQASWTKTRGGGAVYRFTHNGTTTTFERLRRSGCPPEILSALGILPIHTQKGDVWPQIEPQPSVPFILGTPSPTQAAEILCATSEAHILTHAIKALNKRASKELTTTEILREQEATTRLILAPVQDRDLNLRLLDNRIYTNETKIELLKNRKKTLTKAKHALQLALQRTIAVMGAPEPILPLNPSTQLERLRKLRAIQASPTPHILPPPATIPVPPRITELRDRIAKLKRISVDRRRIPAPPPIIHQRQGLTVEHRARLTHLKRLRTELNQTAAALAEADNTANTLRSLLLQTEQEIANAAATLPKCPTCGRSFDTEHEAHREAETTH